MAFHYIGFEVGGVEVPIMALNPSQDHSPAPARSALLETLGGYIDYYGDNDAPQTSQVLVMAGLAWGDKTYLVTGSGANVAVAGHNYLLAGTYQDMLRSELEQLRALVGKSGRLIRHGLNNHVRQWRQARLREMSQPQEVQDRDFMAAVTLSFETAQCSWKSETAQTVTATASVGAPARLYPTNASGMTIHDAVLTLTWLSGTVTQIDVDAATVGIDLRWTGSLTTGALVIDASTLTVRKAGVDAFVSGFMQAGHVAKSWLPLPIGETEISVTVVGGSLSAQLQWYPQWK